MSPVVNEESSEAKKAATAAISSGLPGLFIGIGVMCGEESPELASVFEDPDGGA